MPGQDNDSDMPEARPRYARSKTTLCHQTNWDVQSNKYAMRQTFSEPGSSDALRGKKNKEDTRMRSPNSLGSPQVNVVFQARLNLSR